MEDQILDTPLPTESPSPANLPYSTIGSRILASLLDGLIMVFVTVAIFFASTIDIKMFYVASIAQIAFILFYNVYLVQASGTTPGKRVMHLKIVKLDGTPVSWSEAIMRFLPFFILALASEVIDLSGMLSVDPYTYNQLSWYEKLQPLADSNPDATNAIRYTNLAWTLADIIVFLVNSNRRALHDIVAGTIVISTHPKDQPSS